ncbi:hypothetical protein AC231_15330 [Clostridium pasteurianum]|uniref:hypothetical protein n=1 Tax=Clostridium pasteurianum TaxID=1501 RepID=UPI00097ADBE7|nr:hypothetical protein [Clostridium pasteurianum]OMH21775.1 hypothetical protein AC231_15330 [Clostridium pasteurianum]
MANKKVKVNSLYQRDEKQQLNLTWKLQKEWEFQLKEDVKRMLLQNRKIQLAKLKIPVKIENDFYTMSINL